jgi:ketosteroid isomerase-like protein
MNSNPDPSEEDRVLAVEDEYVAAEVNRDEATLHRILDDRFVLNSNHGTTAGKAELIEGVLSWNMTGQEITERTVLVDSDTAIVFGTTEPSFASDINGASTSVLRYTSIYVKRADEWRYIALHMAKHEDKG